jgi:hypothetical protein
MYTNKSTPQCIHHRGVETPRCIHHRGVKTPWCIHYRRVETPQCIHHWRIETRRCIHHQGVVLPILRRFIILKSTVGYFNYLGTCHLCLQKLANLRDSNRLPGVFITGESITHMNNSTNIRKNTKSFLGMPIGTRRSCMMIKTGGEKSRDTVPLS